MTLENETIAAADVREPKTGIGRVWFLFIDALAALGTSLIGALMIIICADILARNLMGSSLPLVSELGALLLVMIVCLQLASTVRANRLARTELFFVAFQARWPRAGSFLSALFNLVGGLALAGISWASVAILQKDFNSGEFIGVSGIATTPTWPFRSLILLGMIVAALQFFVAMAGDLRLALKPGGPR